MRRNLLFEERAYQKEEKENSNSSSSLSYNISIEDAPMMNSITSKTRLACICLVVLIAYTTMKLRKTISFKLPLAP